MVVKRLGFVSMLVCVAGLSTVVHADVTLVKEGAAAAVILIPVEADPAEKAAGDELQLHIEKITGAKLPIKPVAKDAVDTEAKAAGAAVVVGASLQPAGFLDPLAKTSTDPGAFTLSVSGNRVNLAGNGPAGTQIAAYELLEQLGVRWFIPGELGTVIPSSKSVVVKDQTTRQVPSFKARWAAPLDKEWSLRQRMGGHYFAGAHGIHPFAGSAAQRRKQLEEMPEVFALNSKTGKRIISQVCVSNPLTLKMTIEAAKAHFRKPTNPGSIAMGPNDGRGFCECENCKKLDSGDWDAFSNEPSVTDRYFWFYNQVLKGIEDEFPDKRLETYIYHSYMRPPVNVVPDKRIRGALAPIALCRAHGPDNHICPEKSYYLWLADAWSKKLPEIYDRGYWFNLADPGFPFVMVGRMRVEIPAAHKAGLHGWRVEALGHWASETPSLYVAGRLMWDINADVDAILQDYADKFYGPASAPMLRYVKLFDDALTNSDFHTGTSFDAPLLYPKALRDKARADLDAAAKLAGDSVYGKRVALSRKSFDMLDAFIGMVESRNVHDWKASMTHLQKLDVLQEDLLKNYTPSMLHNRVAVSYLRRFFRAPTEQGFERTTGGNTFLAGLPDEWQFQIDPQAVGELLNWHNPFYTGGNWEKKLTSSSSWSNQGLRYYKGEAWYKTTVKIPAEAKGKRVFLWFGGVDENAKVYLNGQALGISPGSAFTPFEVDATPAVKAGEDNVVVVRVMNERVDELGTGGITAPAFFYLPKDGENAKLQNTRDLGLTFP
jgi:hypothetical protein